MTLKHRAPFNLEEALLDPAQAFDRPQDVLEVPDISDGLKRRILQGWRLDAHRKLTDPVRDVPDEHEFNILSDINEALARIDARDAPGQDKGS